MQLTIGDHAVVFDLEKRCDVAVIQQLSDFEKPTEFSSTGFLLDTPFHSFEINEDATLSVERR